jgi:hypothetical protein
MSELESTLEELGIRLFKSQHEWEKSISFEMSGAYASFSGYGEFVPITVSSETKLRDANMERHRPGNPEHY